jgi:flavin reductase (DIM6/NTAB) family NADH-FMN oxidoreductase RutF
MRFVEPAEFKRGMRGLAAGVCVLTTAHEGKRWGLTATSVCSFSAEPPLLIVCVNRGAEAHDPMLASRRICVNVLAQDQAAVAERFSGAGGHKGESRFAGLSWHEGVTGAPVLDDGVAAFDCRITDRYECSTHSAFVCAVLRVERREAAAPLVYCDRTFAGLALPTLDAAAE